MLREEYVSGDEGGSEGGRIWFIDMAGGSVSLSSS